MKHPMLLTLSAAIAAFVLPEEALANTDEAVTMAVDTDVAASFDGEAASILAADVVSDEELGEQRGGFVIAGMEVRLGAEMRTYLNGDLALMTVVNWGASGVTVTQTASGALTPARLDALQAGLATTGNFALKVGDAPVYLANDGQTALAQRFDNAIQNVLVNTASNITVTQQTEATIDLSGYQAFQADIISSRMAESLGASLGAATMGTLGQ